MKRPFSVNMAFGKLSMEWGDARVGDWDLPEVQHPQVLQTAQKLQTRVGDLGVIEPHGARKPRGFPSFPDVNPLFLEC